MEERDERKLISDFIAPIEPMPLRERGVDSGKAGPGRGRKTGSDATRFGRDSTYLAAPIKRDRPDIAARVCSAFDIARRRANLSFAHHTEIAGLDDPAD